MMMARSIAIAGVLMMLTAACGANKPRVATTDRTSAASVGTRKTYVIEVADMPPPGYSPAKRSKTVLEMARPKVDAELGKKGYTVAAADADLIVRLGAGVKTVVDQPTGAAQIAGADSDLDEVSTLAINILDGKSRESLFAGSASKEIHSRTVKDADVTSAVTEILAKIPPSGSSAP